MIRIIVNDTISYRHIDEGKHPDSWLRAALIDAKEENEAAHGKSTEIFDFSNRLKMALRQTASAELQSLLLDQPPEATMAAAAEDQHIDVLDFDK